MPRDEEAMPEDPTSVPARYLRPFAQRLGELLIQGERSDYDQGKAIEEAKRGQYWKRWPSSAFDTFQDWCWHVLGYRSRKAEILQRNWKLLTGLNVAEDTLTRALRLGWTKLARILPVSPDEVTLLRWIDRIETEKLSEDDLRSLTRQSAANDPDDAGETGAPKAVSFRLVFEEQGALDTFMLALKAIKKRYGTEMGWGQCAALMAASYAATMPRDDEGGAPIELENLLTAMEHTFRTRLMVADAQPVAPTRPAPRAAAPVQTPETTDAVRSASLEM